MAAEAGVSAIQIRAAPDFLRARRALIAYAGGERGRCRMVRVPTVVEEDAKRTHRERKRLVKERTGHINRIKALLALHGIADYEPIKAGRRQCLHVLVTHDG